jgi:energy-coupling factor transporter ATP-binding protein EcfA2
MYCLQVYRNNSLPEENQLLIKQLWNEIIVRYGIKRTLELLTKECTSKDLIFDIDCRRRHLMNLTSLYSRFCGQNRRLVETEYIVNQLADTIRFIKDKTDDNLDDCKYFYRRVISTGDNDNDIGLQYISLCESLQFEISEAEYCSMFPKTNVKINEWLHQQGSSKEFQPKFLNLFQIIEQDLIDQWSNPYMIVRTKIGVIGYTGTGKSSLINCLLGVQSLTEEGAVPVSANRGTYFPLQFEKKQPLIDPDDKKKKTAVTFVDIQGADKEEDLVDGEVKEDNYLDEICKADCDIYILVYDEELHEVQQKWIIYIEDILRRKCVLVRSKIDIDYLKKFQELSAISFVGSERRQRQLFESTIIRQLRLENAIEARSIYLVACDYCPNSSEAALLLKEQSFDYSSLLNELSRLAFDACSSRIHALANRTIARAINTIFRRGYVLNIMKYKVAAGFASIIPFGDQLPRHISRDRIRDAFGIDDALRQYLTQFHLIIYNYKLQTSQFKDCVEIKELHIDSKLDTKWVGRAAGTALLVSGGFTDEILQAAAPVAIAASGAARAVFTVATIGIGVVITAGVSAWSAVDSGKHIFSYINRVCDDAIMVTNPLIASIIEREREKVFGNNNSTTSTTDSVQNNNDTCL